MIMHDPPHPGEVLSRTLPVAARPGTVTEAAAPPSPSDYDLGRLRNNV